jgi:phosphomannomutase
VTEEIARRLDCPVMRTPVGEINVVECMIAENAVLGGEGNGGVIDPRVGYVRDSFVAMAMVLDLLSSTGAKLSELAQELPKYAMIKQQYPLGKSGDGRSSGPTSASPVDGLWDRIAAACSDADADRRDGLRLDWEDRWVHIRSSNTEPIVRVIAEAAEPAQARELADRIGGWVGEMGERQR